MTAGRPFLLAIVAAAGCAAPPVPVAQAATAPAAPPASTPAPAAPAPPDAPAPDDPLELLYAHRLAFASDGSPLITVRIDEGEASARLFGKGQVLLSGRDAAAGAVAVPAGAPFALRVRDAVPGELLFSAQVAELPVRDKAGVKASHEEWTGRGYPVRVVVEGGVYGIAGRVLDTRRYAVLLGAPQARAAAQQLADEAARKFGGKPVLRGELTRRPAGTIEAVDEAGAVLATGRSVLVVDVPGGEGVTVSQVEHDLGYAAHGREDRTYRGRVFATVGADGTLTLVNVLPLEELLRGIVPSEIYATAPAAALRAQAVTARGEVLAKIGARHLADPFLLCAEQHCQVHKGVGGEHPGTDAAIRATRGEALFARGGGLVDSVYSSTCGGHTEHNEVVWGGPPDPNLRGVPDWDGHPPALAAFEARIDDGEVPAFLAASVPAFCSTASLSRPEKYRWEKRFSAAELDALVAELGVGKVTSLAVTGRGVSGRALGLAITGDRGATVVKGELNIRRRLKNLNSALFVVEREGPPDGPPTAWLFRGAGWGHGVGMCQTGAIGRAEAGYGHREILGHYFGGAEVVRIY